MLKGLVASFHMLQKSSKKMLMAPNENSSKIANTKWWEEEEVRWQAASGRVGQIKYSWVSLLRTLNDNALVGLKAVQR